MNEKNWKEKLKEAYQNVVAEKDNVKQQIEKKVNEVDAVELLSHISLLSQYVPEGSSESFQGLGEKPILHFLSGIVLKNSKPSDKHPSNEDVGKLIELLNKYYTNSIFELIFQTMENKEMSESDELIFKARIQKIISQINPSIYEYQLKDYLDSVIGNFDDYFLKKIGFTISDAWNFGKKIMGSYVKNVNKRYDKHKEAEKKAKQALADPVQGQEIRKNLKEKNISEEEYIQSFVIFNVFTLTKKLFVFNADEFCEEEEISETEKFKNYLKTLSCKFGDNKKFEYILDDNIVLIKPLIDILDEYFFAPIPKDLIFNLPSIFEKLLEDEKQNNTRIWQRYQIKKSKFTVDKICEYLSRTFSQFPQAIFKNLHYKYNGKDGEVDVLCLYDNKIFFIEAKSNIFTEPAKRGAIERLKTNLKKLIEDAYYQGRKARDYITSTETAIFTDKNGNTVLEINTKDNKFDLFLINVTLESLMSFNTGLKMLQPLGLFKENEFPWSVNLSELDIITDLILSPTIFIHYLERRLAAQDENIFRSFDELSFFGYYLENGNFYPPVLENGKIPDFIMFDVSYISIFDDYYLHGKKRPELNIEADLGRIIQALETLGPYGYSNITSALLDFDHEARKYILKNIDKLVKRTKEDGKKHNFTAVYKTAFDIGFTFISQKGRKDLMEQLFSYCSLKKYQTKTTKWIGMGKDVIDDKWFINEFFYLNNPWKKDSKLDELVKNKLSKSKS